MRLGDLVRNVGWVAAVSISIFVHAIGESDSARAESKRHSKKSAALVTAQTSNWDHNGSLVSLISEGAKQKFIYETPRIGLTDAGVAPGTLLFEGQRKGQNITGTAYQFYRSCKAHSYAVSGTVSDDRKQIILKGKVPQLDVNCHITGSRDDTLIFTASQITPSEPPKDATTTAATRAPASTSTTNFPSEANKIEASKPSVANLASSAPPASTQAAEKPAAETGNAKPAVANATSSTAAPNEPPKDKQVAANPPPESKPAPPAEPAKSESAKGGPPKDVKPPVAAQSAANTPAAAKTEPPKDAKPPVAAQTPASTSAAAKTATPPGEPPKDSQSVAALDANTGASKSESAPPPANRVERGNPPPPSEPAKNTQTAAIPEATGSTAKTDAKTDDASKTKNTTAAAVVSAPANLPDKSKSDASKADANKAPAATENRAAAVGGPEKMMEIVLKNGRILRIGRDIEPEALAKIIAQLER